MHTIPAGVGSCKCVDIFKGLEDAFDPIIPTKDWEDPILEEGTDKVVIGKPDTGKHYRLEYKGIKLDPYRIFEIYNITDAKAQHGIKKLLRMTGKGHTKKQVWLEVLDIVNRALEMIEEDELIKEEYENE